MHLEDARRLQAGDVVVHRYTMPSERPVKVKAVWRNAKGTIVLVRLPSIDRHAWLDATGYELPPDGKRWCQQHGEWEDAPIYESRHPKDLKE